MDGFYKTDIYIPSTKTVIEVNGQQHYNGLGKCIIRKRFLTRRRILRGLGYKTCEIIISDYLRYRERGEAVRSIKQALLFGST